ncbi:MAG TPA: PDZ domain-containing protein [Propionibacterium sp.]|nr:PDZ domain-containing protein [Propionibacterium sp.]
MTKQTWTAAVSALLFVVAAAIVAMTPVPFVTYSAGATHELLGEVDGQPVISVEGLDTYESVGRVLMTTVSITRSDAPVSLPEVLYAHWAPDREVYPRDYVYPPSSGVAEISAREAQQMATSQADAAAAALRAAGIAVEQVPMVQSVASTGPANEKIFPGDFVLAVDGVPTPTVADVREAVESRAIGESITFMVRRDREERAVTFDTASSKTQDGLPVWGGNLVMGYSYAPRVHINLDPGLGGPSAGLMLALAVFESITPDDVSGERVLAGTGAIDGAGTVSQVGGIREKLAGAERAGADIFFVPDSNCSDLAGVESSVRIVSVGTLEDAIASLDLLNDPATEQLVRGCA